ncbi:maleylpyruvate isomerase family mycothiol-dependent enzyme [Leekyejoonella antrihumi]|uniref:Maleylpyruvate isomerase family mycothiol-dependent enzyme n=1 Tax=Leekyejoonella antrihumi TaxID=1660198 RepID=A0A563DVZ2_9MICO|nr:maleylpyruvate isomerase family mycothiol-dependent enzyme [Leekyejoonella antrihumi]TWP34376.1 maleylpyruvate isomerase family mycothiol-dependent enzyme [Leekyejoonella antrihumi]
MPASLPFESYLDALPMATARLHDESVKAGLDASVPTCPGWKVRALLAHQGMVHRWATGYLRGERHLDTEAMKADGLQQSDPGAWVVAGSKALETVLRASADDLNVRFFLPDAGRPRDAWARRQAHETAIHAVDALAAGLGGYPEAHAADIDAQFASDGIDELLCGFLTRPGEQMRTEAPVTVLVHASDTDRAWTVRLSDQPAVATPGRPDSEPDTTWTGTAAQLYLGLWNRGLEIRQDGFDALQVWRRNMTVGWS